MPAVPHAPRARQVGQFDHGIAIIGPAFHTFLEQLGGGLELSQVLQEPRVQEPVIRRVGAGGTAAFGQRACIADFAQGKAQVRLGHHDGGRLRARPGHALQARARRQDFAATQQPRHELHDPLRVVGQMARGLQERARRGTPLLAQGHDIGQLQARRRVVGCQLQQ